MTDSHPQEITETEGTAAERDLGFGSVVATETQERLLNRDGSFNVERHGLGLRASLHPYYSLLRMSWPRFLLLVAGLYFTTNAFFAMTYVALGEGSLAGPAGPTQWEQLQQAFFFSVQTLSTIGYGEILPVTTAANVLVTFEALIGLFGFALAAGLVFARFSRPMANITFSKHAIIAPYRGITAFEFRIVNQRRNQLIELEAKVLFSRLEESDGKLKRSFYELPLERRRVTFFPLSWTIVHPIDDESPLHGATEKQCLQADAEFLILLTGIDETFSQTVHARSSYRADEVLWNVKFDDIFHHPTGSERLSIDVGRLDRVVPLNPSPEKRDLGDAKPIR